MTSLKDTESHDPENDQIEYSKIKENKNLKNAKPPSHVTEMAFVMINMFFLKFYNETFFDAMTFFNIAVPMMIYLIGTLFITLMEFIKLIHIEDLEGNESEELITPNQIKLLFRIIRDLSAYFGLYYFTSQIDKVFTLKDEALDSIKMNF